MWLTSALHSRSVLFLTLQLLAPLSLSWDLEPELLLLFSLLRIVKSGLKCLKFALICRNPLGFIVVARSNPWNDETANASFYSLNWLIECSGVTVLLRRFWLEVAVRIAFCGSSRLLSLVTVDYFSFATLIILYHGGAVLFRFRPWTITPFFL